MSESSDSSCLSLRARAAASTMSASSSRLAGSLRRGRTESSGASRAGNACVDGLSASGLSKDSVLEVVEALYGVNLV